MAIGRQLVALQFDSRCADGLNDGRLEADHVRFLHQRVHHFWYCWGYD